MIKVIFWTVAFGVLINSVRCQDKSGNQDRMDEFVIVGSVILLVGFFIAVLCCVAKCHKKVPQTDAEVLVENGVGNPSTNRPVFVIDSTFDPPPKYSELGCETPPPSFDSIFPVSLQICSDVKTAHLQDPAQPPTSPENTNCEKL